MSLFRQHRPDDDPIERLLRDNRPEPSEELSRSVLGRIATQRRRAGFRVPAFGGKLAAAATVTVLALVGAAAAAGGVGHTTHFWNFNVGGTFGFDKHKNTYFTDYKGNDSKGKDGKGKDGKGDDNDNDHHNGGGDHQYSFHLCHATGSKTNPYVEIVVSYQGLQNHLLHHPNDIYPVPSGGCPKKVPHDH